MINLIYSVFPYIGRAVQIYIIYSIHAAVFYELTCIESRLLSFSQYDRDFNHLTGWPPYFLLLFYYYKSCTKHAGPVRKNWSNYCKTERYDLRQCLQCPSIKPGRTSHCSRCNVCVYRRDHHCLFINNCVGFHNHKAFIWFLFFALLGSVHFIVRGTYWLIAWHNDEINEYGYAYAVVFALHVYNIIGFTGLIAILLFKTVKNLHCGTVTMEGWMEKKCFSDSPVNRFDLGFVENWTLVLGENCFLWFSTGPSGKRVACGPDMPQKPCYV